MVFEHLQHGLAPDLIRRDAGRHIQWKIGLPIAGRLAVERPHEADLPDLPSLVDIEVATDAGTPNTFPDLNVADLRSDGAPRARGTEGGRGGNRGGQAL